MMCKRPQRAMTMKWIKSTKAAKASTATGMQTHQESNFFALGKHNRDQFYCVGQIKEVDEA